MRLFNCESVEQANDNNQLTVISYFGRRESLVLDLFDILKQKKYTCIYDPFSGCASVSFAAMKKGLAKYFVINESLPVFECIWKHIKNHPDEFIAVYSGLVREYCDLSKDQRVKFYNERLVEFNQNNNSGMMARAAILFVFLMNFSENHVPYFDDPHTMTSRPNIFIDSATELKALDQFKNRTEYLSSLFHQYNTLFKTGDFEDCLNTVAPGDLVVMDPPYPRQADNVYFKPLKEKPLQNKIRNTLQSLNERKIDFIIFYGSRIVDVEDQFDEDEYNVNHLVRLTQHRDYGYFLDHIYVSSSIPLIQQDLPSGVAFYKSFFDLNVPMSNDIYQTAIMTLLLQVNGEEKLSINSFVSKL